MHPPVFVRQRGSRRRGSTPTIYNAQPRTFQNVCKERPHLGHRGSTPCYAVEVPGDQPLPEGLAYFEYANLPASSRTRSLPLPGLQSR